MASQPPGSPPSIAASPVSLDSDLSFIPEAVVVVAASARDGGGSGFPQLAGMAWSQDRSPESSVSRPWLLDLNPAFHSGTQESWEL